MRKKLVAIQSLYDNGYKENFGVCFRAFRFTLLANVNRSVLLINLRMDSEDIDYSDALKAVAEMYK